MICQIEEKIAALPDELTNENRVSIQSQLNEIMALYETLEEEEKSQIDMTRCTELQAQTGPANTASAGMTVHIETLASKTISIQIEPTDSIKDLKEKIQDKTGIPISEQVLIFAGKELKDEYTLQDYSIQKDSEIYAAQKIPYLDKNGEQQIAVVKDRINEYAQKLGSEDTTTWYVVYGDTTAQNRLEVLGNVHLILMDGDDLNAPYGISVEKENTLTIYGQSTGGTMGTLTATNTEMSAAIGGGNSATGTITINGGTINAHATNGAGIGGGVAYNGGTITINGGIIDAGSRNAAAIGGGASTSEAGGDGGKITINGGTITASGGNKSAGIGGSSNSGATGGIIAINGGIVHAEGGMDGDGIGKGKFGGAGTFTVSGGAVIYTSVISDKSDQENWKGIIFEGKSGKVYGDLTLTTELDIDEDMTLEIPKGTVLTVDKNASFNNLGKLTGEGIITPDQYKQPAAIAIEADLSKIYDGKPVDDSGSFYSYTGNGSPIVKWYADSGSGKGEELQTAPTDAGTYYVGVSAPATGIYQAVAEQTAKVTIGKGIQEAPAAPTLNSKTDTSVTLNEISGAEYVCGTSSGTYGDWQADPTFDGLKPETTYYFAARYPENDNYFQSAISEVLTVQTDKSPAGEDSSGNGSGSSSSGSSSRPAYTPSIPKADNGSATVIPSRPSKGETVTIHPKPNPGYEVDEVVVTDGNGNKLEVTVGKDGTFTFTQPDSKVKITVTYKAESQPAWDNPFSDVSESDWFYSAVEYVCEHSLMTGTSEDTFAPDTVTSRAMAVTILWRLEGSPVVNYAMDFDDAAEDQWYSEAVRWAASTGIAGGYGNGRFGTNDPITREQLASILYRFAQKQGHDTSAQSDISGYTDAAAVSSYAVEAVSWANAAGIINGTSATALTPQGDAVRAQTAAMLMRFCEKYKLFE